MPYLWVRRFVVSNLPAEREPNVRAGVGHRWRRSFGTQSERESRERARV